MAEEADVLAWAERNGVRFGLDALGTADCDAGWRVSATTDDGVIDLVVYTDGHKPDPFDHLFGVWRMEPPTGTEFGAAVAVLGAGAVGELAALIDW